MFKTKVCTNKGKKLFSQWNNFFSWDNFSCLFFHFVLDFIFNEISCSTTLVVSNVISCSMFQFSLFVFLYPTFEHQASTWFVHKIRSWKFSQNIPVLEKSKTKTWCIILSHLISFVTEPSFSFTANIFFKLPLNYWYLHSLT